MPNDIEQKLSEDVHYKIIPQADAADGWDVRLLEEYPETVIRYGSVKIVEEGDDGYLKYDMEIVFTPDPDLDIDEDLPFQIYCGRILSSIIEQSIHDGSMIASDDKTGEMYAADEMHEQVKELLEDEYQSGTDSIEELTD